MSVLSVLGLGLGGIEVVPDHVRRYGEVPEIEAITATPSWNSRGRGRVAMAGAPGGGGGGIELSSPVGAQVAVQVPVKEGL